jgi:RNA polymerase-binding transcription factor DksA
MKHKQPAPRIPTKWRQHHRKLLALREFLLAARDGPSPAKIRSDELEHSLALGILSRENDALSEVDAAIQRIQDGTYGICHETGEPIPEVRLRIVPWTRFTKEALERREREGLVEQMRLGPVGATKDSAHRGGTATWSINRTSP